MKKKQRGYMESATTTDGKLSLVKWKDSQVVTVMSTIYGANPTDKATRWCANQKKKVEVSRPRAIRLYNTYMGGTDRFNQNVNAYRINMGGKKFYWAIITWLIDACLVNAWTLHHTSGGEFSLLRFRREVVMTILKRYGVPPSVRGVPRSTIGSIRHDGRDHFPGNIDDGKRERCKNPNCFKKDGAVRGPLIRKKGTKCNVALCMECFEPYHTQQ